MTDSDLVARTYNYVKADTLHNIALDNQLQADFLTGPLAHKVLFGVDYFISGHSTSTIGSALIAPIDAYSPVYGTAVPSFASLAPFILRDDKQSQAGVYLQDQVKLDRWTLTLTGRQDWANTGFTSKAIFPPAGTYLANDSAQTGRVGLNYLFDIGLSPYVSYSTSFAPTSAPIIAGNSFKPTTGEGDRNRRQVQANRIELHDHGGGL